MNNWKDVSAAFNSYTKTVNNAWGIAYSPSESNLAPTKNAREEAFDRLRRIREELDQSKEYGLDVDKQWLWEIVAGTFGMLNERDRKP